MFKDVLKNDSKNDFAKKQLEMLENSLEFAKTKIKKPAGEMEIFNMKMFKGILQNDSNNQFAKNQIKFLEDSYDFTASGGKKRRKKKSKKSVRRHQGINQSTGRLKKGYKYSGKLKSGLSKIVKVSRK